MFFFLSKHVVLGGEPAKKRMESVGLSIDTWNYGCQDWWARMVLVAVVPLGFLHLSIVRFQLFSMLSDVFLTIFL